MASWTNQEPKGATQRKKWNLEDRTSLKNLKHHFAEDGCSEVQFELAKQLLEGESESDIENNYAQGVHWLLRAAQQGHADALDLLTDCFKSGRGINDANECEVRTCLAMSPGERGARRAARELFACLSNGEEYITAAQLERRMRQIYRLQNTDSCGDGSEATASSGKDIAKESLPSTPINGNASHYMSSASSSQSSNRFNLNRSDISESDLLTEAHLLSAAVHYSNGHLPPVSRVLSLSVPAPQSLDHIPCFHRPIFHPILFILLVYHRFVKAMASLPGSITGNLKFIVLLLLYTVAATDNLLMFVPMGIYYISLLVMFVATFKMLKSKHEFIDFRIWSGLFLRYGDETIDSDQSENQFLRNNMKPYLYFFVALVANLMIYPIISDQWAPHSEVTVFSFILVFVTMFAFMKSARPFPDYLMLISFGVNVLAKYPYEMDSVVTTGWRFLDLKVPNFSSFVIGNGIEFCLNCRAFLYLLIPGCLVMLGRRTSWHGTYSSLIPHCVTLSWLQICITSSQCATGFGLMRAALGLAGLLLFLPLFGIVTLLIPVFAAVEWLSLNDPRVHLFASIAVGIVILIGSCLMAANHRTEKYVTVLQIAFCVLATVFLSFPYMRSEFETAHDRAPSMYDSLIRPKSDASHHPFEHTIAWENYAHYCLPESMANRIQTQLRCRPFDGLEVHWTGNVKRAHISHIANLRADLISNYLPKFVGDPITCFYGDQTTVDCEAADNCEELQSFLTDHRKCNLDRWNTYEYQIVTRMAPIGGILAKPLEIVVVAGDFFGNFTLRLNNSDRIWFQGTVHHSIGNADERPTVNINSIGCVECHDRELKSAKIAGSSMVARKRDLMRGAKYLLNVLFNPLLTFK